MRIWTAAQAEAVMGRCTEGIAILGKLLHTTASEPAADVVAWGQYLDLEHGNNEQWGLYGTAAGLQIVSMMAKGAGERAEEQSQVERALRLLPEDPDQGHALLEQKREKGDFDNVLKLAAIAEGLRPDSAQISLDAEPPIVRRLRDLALPQGGWTTRPEGSDAREFRERDLATAYILHAWRRYELGSVGLEARRWLARQLVEGVPIKGKDLLALAGLALTAHPLDANDPPIVKRAIDHVDGLLVSWARERDDVRVDRPMFNGFSVGSTTDYLFLHPEILASLFFVRHGNPIATRAFVIEVGNAVSENIESNNGLMVSNGVMATVDQLWAFRFLYELRQLHEAKGLEAIAPPADQEQVRARARGLWRSGRKKLAQAMRLWVSKEAGYLARAAKGLLVVIPLVVAVLAALLLFEHPREGIASLIVGGGLTFGFGYLFFLKGGNSS